MEQKLPNNLEVGERIRKIREDLNMNRETFSEMIDVSDVFLGQIERGERSLSLKTLCRIVSFTGASTDYILLGNAETNSTIDKIVRILRKSSNHMIKFVFQFIIASYHSFKNNKEEN